MPQTSPIPFEMQRTMAFTGQKTSLLTGQPSSVWGDEYVERINKAYEKNLANDNVEWLHGRAHFTSKNEVEVECDDGRKEHIKSDHILIATGGHPKFLYNIEG